MKLKKVKLILNAGKAVPTPPVGPVLGQYGINLSQFCKDFNEITKEYEGLSVAVSVFIQDNKKFFLRVKKPTSTSLLKKYMRNENSFKYINSSDLITIAELKIADCNSKSIKACVNSLIGTAKSMGFVIKN